MIILRYHRRVENDNFPAFVTYKTIGKVYSIDGSTARILILN